MFESLLAHPVVADLRASVAPMRNGLHAAGNEWRAHADELWRKFSEPNKHEHMPPTVTLFQPRTQQGQTPKAAPQPPASLGLPSQRMTPTSKTPQPPHDPLSVHSWVEPSKPTPLPGQTHAHTHPYAQYGKLDEHLSWANVSKEVRDRQARGYDQEAKARAADAEKKWQAWVAANPEEAKQQLERSRQYWLNLYAGTPPKNTNSRAL
jgi:hypothetical protein